MVHIIILSYIITLLIGISGLTVQILAGRGNDTRQNRASGGFMVALLIVNVYDFIIYYNDNIWGAFDPDILVRIGDCFIAIIIYLWLRVQYAILNGDAFHWVVQVIKGLVAAYILAWFICQTIELLMGVFPAEKWIYTFADVVMVAMLMTGAIAYAGESASRRMPRHVTRYMVTVTTMMILNYVTYFTSQVGRLWGRYQYTDELMTWTVFFWFIINVANLIMTYKHNFVVFTGEKEKEIVPFNLEEALDRVKVQYDLTPREIDLVREIYRGKSNQEIGEELFISESTVKTHIYNIFRKLGVKNRVEIACILRGER